jgi:flagellar protein FlaI
MKSLDKYKNVEIFQREDDIPFYHLDRSEFQDEELVRIKNRVRDLAIIEIDIDPAKIPDHSLRKDIFIKEILDVMEKRKLDLTEVEKTRIAEAVVMDMVGYGPIDPLLEDPNLEEIMAVGSTSPVMVYHKKYGACETNIKFSGETELRHVIEKLARDVKKRIDYNSPLLDARLPDGSRVNITIPPISLDGSSVTIRKFRAEPISVVDLINFGTMTTELAAFLWTAIEGLGVQPCNIIMAGGTASGKTSTLNAILAFVPRLERIVTIEDTAEIYLRHKNRVRLETRPPNVEGRGEIDMDTLLKNALRMRPDRIIVGEVRGAEAMTLFTAMNTGHDGCMSTIHANSSNDVLTRLINPPMQVNKSMIQALDLIIMQKKFFDREIGVVRRISEVTEISMSESGDLQTNNVYKWNPVTDSIKGTGIPSRTQFRLEEFAEAKGMDFTEEMEKRKSFIEELVAENVREFTSFQARLNEYLSMGQLNA